MKLDGRKRNGRSGKETEPKARSPAAFFFIRLIKEKPLGTAGGIIVLIMLLTGIFADFLAAYEITDQKLSDRLTPPSSQYILGTDQLGRDILSRIIYGARVSMIVGLAGASLGAVIAVTIGVLSGFLGGRFDIVVQRFVDAWMCFPLLFIILTVMSVLGSGLLQVILVLGVLSGIGGSRIIRSSVITVKEKVYIGASRAIGSTTPRILLRHILPNITAPIIVLFTISAGNMILMEAIVSFLGFGIPPPIPSWGSMLGQGARRYMLTAPWLAIWPGAALAIVVFGINMLGDAIRDILDPRLRGGAGRYGRVASTIFKKSV
jgi:peptide/nickel transport system permease protein